MFPALAVTGVQGHARGPVNGYLARWAIRGSAERTDKSGVPDITPQIYCPARRITDRTHTDAKSHDMVTSCTTNGNHLLTAGELKR